MKLLVVGDALLDRDLIGRVDRVCPDAPVPVVDVLGVDERPGGAGLAALLAARSGAEVVLVAGLGADPSGDRVRRLLKDRVGVHDLLLTPTTAGKTRVRVGDQSLLRLDDHGHLLGHAGHGAPSGGANDDPTREHAGPVRPVDGGLLRSLAHECDAVLVADYGGPVTSNPAIRTVLRELTDRMPVVWDPHPRGAAPVPGCAVVTPNRAEAEAFAAPAELGSLAERLRSLWSAEAVCVTDGARGVLTAHAGGGFTTPAWALPSAVDTCGAGDRYAGALALGLAAGLQLPKAVARAVDATGGWLAGGGVGRTPDADALGGAPSAQEVVADVRRRGGTVAATGGCFDVLHAGHLALLQSARSLADALVVLLNSDESVRRLKGEGRPVHRAADRARLLAALTCVDAVAVFEDDDPSATLQWLRPDIWVKGGDYCGRELPEAAVVQQAGGRVVLVPYLDGHSTSRILAGPADR